MILRSFGMNPNTAVPKFFHKKDIFCLCLILVLAVALGSFFFLRPKGNSATVRIGGEIRETLSLNLDGEYPFENNGISLTVQVKDGQVAIVHSTCPDKLCMQAGFLQTAGTAAVCLPAGLSVTVEGTSFADAVTY